MLAPAQLPERFATWNRRNGAPFGYDRPRRELLRRFYSDEAWQKLRGPFSIQTNNKSRQYEYPWAYEAAELKTPKAVVEIGGSLAGFQFMLNKAGHEVTNVDPGLEADGVGWPCDQESVARLNGWFDTRVTLKNTTIDQAELPSEHYDVFFSISVLEHLPPKDLAAVMKHAARCLKPGGRFVITLDLFLNLAPFTNRQENQYGSNHSVRDLVEASGLQLLIGDRAELCGYPEFDHTMILANLDRYLIGSYPVLTQCIVLTK